MNYNCDKLFPNGLQRAIAGSIEIRSNSNNLGKTGEKKLWDTVTITVKEKQESLLKKQIENHFRESMKYWQISVMSNQN